MRALVFRRHGGPETLESAEMPLPEPGPGEVRVALRAAALNHLDIWVRQGLGVEIPMPHIGGSDGAGVVEKVGAGVTMRKPGEEVLIAPGLSCGQCHECLSGRDSRCASFHILGTRTQGTYATHTVVPATHAIPKPAALSFEHAAALPLTSLTAWHMLFTRAALRPGETVWIPGAASGVGTVATQLAAAAGAQVIASATGPAKLALARSLGASETFDTATTPSHPDEVRRLTAGRGADVVIDHIGGPHLAISVAACARGGRVALCGQTAGKESTVAPRALYAAEVSILGCYMGSRGELVEALEFLTRLNLNPTLDRTFPLAEGADAQRRMEARQNLGKIVLIP